MNALKKSVTKACGAVAKKLVSWYEQVHPTFQVCEKSDYSFMLVGGFRVWWSR
jgi:hypothetical protein